MVTLRSRSTTPASRLALLACIALMLSLVLAGCTIYTGKVTHYTPSPAGVQQRVDCLLSMDASWPNGPETPQSPSTLMGSVPDGFVPDKVFICRPAEVAVDGVSARQVQQEELAGDFTALLAALAVPSDKGEANTVCAAMMELRLGLWLVNAAGDAVQVAWPTDTCGMTLGKPDTQKAIDALKIVDVKVIPAPMPSK